ncbi:hypothetical protein [Acinetobacter junii]|uniref:hypothetical protein n=1 Tax=Acinetobacter junii TaxID=40215 RepID=UPI00300951EB
MYRILERISNIFPSWYELRCIVSETSAIRITRVIEDTLIRSGKFNLPKQLPNRDEVDWEVVVIDATEILVQRPKKNRRNGIAVKKSDIPLNFSYLCTIQQVKY